MNDGMKKIGAVGLITVGVVGMTHAQERMRVTIDPQTGELISKPAESATRQDEHKLPSASQKTGEAKDKVPLKGPRGGFVAEPPARSKSVIKATIKDGETVIHHGEESAR
ncbi:MAG: hypothetical protein RJQ08_03525 [Salinisphaeraceae bacterium]